MQRKATGSFYPENPTKSRQSRSSGPIAPSGEGILAAAEQIANRQGREYDDSEIRVTPAAEEAVSALIESCRYATETSTAVIHAWFL